METAKDSFDPFQMEVAMARTIATSDEYSRRSLELFTRYSSREFAEETTGSPKFLENPNYPFAHVLRLRQDCLHQTK